MTLLLVADIGGTNARLGIIEHTDTPSLPSLKGCIPQLQQTLKCVDYSDPATLIRSYCETQGVPVPAYGCLAIAGPVDHGRVKMTNHNWFFSSQELRDQLGMTSLEVINDFAACAYSVPHLQESDLHSLHTATAREDAPMAILGPGTGFGVAALVPTECGPQIITGEGGHVSFAPTNEREIAILQTLLTRQKHISVENLVSGMGLVTLYQTLAQLDGITPEGFSAADISTQGVAGEDALCRETMERFCALLGSVVGDKALTYGAQGGIYLGGGIAPRLLDFIPRTEFLARLHNKGPMSDYVKKIPVQVITHKTAALLGAGAWIIRQMARAPRNCA